jgi:Amt family ammonium transporter
MQTGFAMLEVGSVNEKNTRNILLKNVLDASIGAVIWWIVGFGFATGTSENGFIGTDRFGLMKDEFMDGSGYTYATWLFQWAFAATTATIVSGAVAERCTIIAYLTYSISLISFIYPVVAQVGWGGGGYMSPWLGTSDKADYFMDCGVIDFAGSGVVHMTGGVAALVGATLLGPRQSFIDGTTQTPTYGPVFQTIGTLILWFGWYGFNGGSTLYIVGYGQVAAKVMVCTTLSAACGALSTLLVGSFIESSAAGQTVIKLEYANNGVLAGLVSITASCAVVEPYGAVIIGVGGGVVYLFASKFIKKCGVDDVVDAFPVHGACGCYGVVMAALFATKENYAAAYGIYEGAEDVCAGLFYGGEGKQLGANVAFCVFVLVWTGVCSLVVFMTLKCFGVLRVSSEVEDSGMDSSEHGVSKKGSASAAGATASVVEMAPKDSKESTGGGGGVTVKQTGAPKGPSFSSTDSMAPTGASTKKGKAKAPSFSSTDKIPEKDKKGKPVKAPSFSSTDSLPAKGANKSPEKAKVGAKISNTRKLGSAV